MIDLKKKFLIYGYGISGKSIAKYLKSKNSNYHIYDDNVISLKSKKVINKDIFSPNKEGAYYYSGGWQIKSIYSLFIGFVFASATIWNVELRFLQPFSWIIGAFFSSITYYLLASK